MLTKKQKELFEFLKNFIEHKGISPSFEEMKNALNLKSKSGIHRLVTSLEQRGFIKRLKHKARAMEITRSLENIFINKDKNSNLISIPLFGSIAAGNPIEAIENPHESIDIPSSFISPNYEYFGLRIKGLSMIEKGICDGDIAIIKKSNTIQNGKIAAILTNENEVTLKTVKVFHDKIHLIPANKNYKETIFNLKDVQIQGSLSGLIRKYN